MSKQEYEEAVDAALCHYVTYTEATRVRKANFVIFRDHFLDSLCPRACAVAMLRT